MLCAVVGMYLSNAIAPVVAVATVLLLIRLRQVPHIQARYFHGWRYTGPSIVIVTGAFIIALLIVSYYDVCDFKESDDKDVVCSVAQVEIWCSIIVMWVYALSEGWHQSAASSRLRNHRLQRLKTTRPDTFVLWLGALDAQEEERRGPVLFTARNMLIFMFLLAIPVATIWNHHPHPTRTTTASGVIKSFSFSSPCFMVVLMLSFATGGHAGTFQNYARSCQLRMQFLSLYLHTLGSSSIDHLSEPSRLLTCWVHARQFTQQNEVNYRLSIISAYLGCMVIVAVATSVFLLLRAFRVVHLGFVVVIALVVFAAWAFYKIFTMVPHILRIPQCTVTQKRLLRWHIIQVSAREGPYRGLKPDGQTADQRQELQLEVDMYIEHIERIYAYIDQHDSPPSVLGVHVTATFVDAMLCLTLSVAIAVISFVLQEVMSK